MGKKSKKIPDDVGEVVAHVDELKAKRSKRKREQTSNNVMLAGPVDSESVSCQTPKRIKRSDGLAHSKYDLIEANENKQALLQEKKISLNGDGRTCVEDSMVIGDERPSTPTKKR